MGKVTPAGQLVSETTTNGGERITPYAGVSEKVQQMLDVSMPSIEPTPIARNFQPPNPLHNAGEYRPGTSATFHGG